MTSGGGKDVAASVRARLANEAKKTNRPFAELLQYYAMERLLYRLSQSPHADKFVLKGALMLVAWRASAFRPTKDIDFLARLPNDIDNVASLFKEVCNLPVTDDGMAFDADSVQGRLIKEDADYEGVRITFRGYLQRARASMQIDVGFGDVVVPPPVLSQYPTILEFAAPELLGYSRETTIAEKFEAMVKLGQLNSRMKDFYDIHLLARQFAFDGPLVCEALRRTFDNRGTTVTASPVAWTPDFVEDPAKQTQWAGFLRKSRLDDAPPTLPETIESVRAFLQPAAAAVESGQPFNFQWQPGGPWE